MLSGWREQRAEVREERYRRGGDFTITPSAARFPAPVTMQSTRACKAAGWHVLEFDLAVFWLVRVN
jgi:hypothetical protein